MAYAPVNGIEVYYEAHGSTTSGIPLVLLHGSLSTIDTSFGAVLASVCRNPTGDDTDTSSPDGVTL